MEMSDIPAWFYTNLLEKIYRSTFFFKVPDFDPRDRTVASDEVLEEYGLPPRPDCRTQPVRYAFWKKMFTPPDSKARVTFVDAREPFVYEEIDRPSTLPRPQESTRALHESNLNWCGAYVTPRGGRMLTEVHGAWTVPGADPPPRPEPADGYSSLTESSQGKDFRSSTWIGLDGQRRYFNASLPQIGTSQFLRVTGAGDVTKASPTVWWQWWLKDAPNPLPIVLPLPVGVGDLVMASIVVVDSTHVKFLIANQTKGIVCTPFIEVEPTSYLGKCGPPGPVHVSGATAEWITERPTNWTTREIFDLPNYGEVNFEECHVVTGRAPRVDEREELPSGAQLVTMYDIKDHPYRSTQVSITRRFGRDRFSTFAVRPANLKRPDTSRASPRWR